MSTPIVTRHDFRELAGARLTEAQALLDVGLWDGAYYLAGYAVELGLKACVITRLMATDAFPDRKFSEHCYTHHIGDLVRLAGLRPAWDLATAADPLLSGYRGVASGWSEQKRYHRVTEAEARALYEAVADAPHGVLQWIATHW